MSKKKIKLVILVNDLSFFYSHRLPIAEAAKDNSYNVLVGYGEHGGVNPKTLEKKGFSLCLVPMERGSTNIIKNMKSFFYIWRFFKRERPDIVHLITIKPYLFGGIIARLIGIPFVVSAVSGLGTLFVHKDLKSRFLRALVYPMYKSAFKHLNQVVIFQNKDDAKKLVNWGVVNSKKIKLIKGSGVRLENFTNLNENKGIPVVCFASRLLVDKGVYEFISAAKLIKKKDIKAKFCLAGDLDEKNPTGLTKNDLDKIKHEGFVKILGYQKDIPKLFANSNIICLPSYREGFPKTLMEAAAATRAVITTNVPGCRDAIIPNKTGLLVPVKNSQALANAIEDLIKNSKKRLNMGKAGRKLAEREFAIEKIVNAHIKIYESLHLK